MSPLLLCLVLLALAIALTVNDGYPSRTPDEVTFLASQLEALQLGPFTAVTATPFTIDSLLVDSYAAAVWEVTATKSDGTTITRRVSASHNGTASADATVATCVSAGSGLSSELTLLDVDLSGAGAAQVMRLRCTLTFGAGTWKVSAWRLPQKPPQYA